MDKPELPPMTAGQVAARFGVTVPTVKRWADTGKLAFFLTPGGHRRFKVADVDALMGETVAPDR